MARKVVAAILLMSFTLTTTEAAIGIGAYKGAPQPPANHGVSMLPWRLAQASQPIPQKQYTSWEGQADGQMSAERISTGGKFVGGLVVGVLTGLIGTGIGYFLIGPAYPDTKALMAYEGKGNDYSLGFEAGWNQKTRSKKRNAFLGGGILGTLVWIVVLSSANSNSQ